MAYIREADKGERVAVDWLSEWEESPALARVLRLMAVGGALLPAMVWGILMSPMLFSIEAWPLVLGFVVVPLALAILAVWRAGFGVLVIALGVFALQTVGRSEDMRPIALPLIIPYTASGFLLLTDGIVRVLRRRRSPGR